MGIKRERAIELQLEPKINKDDMFSYKCWKRAINWDVLLWQIKKTENACQLIDAGLYRSRLFPVYLDILEANLYILDDIFYHQTGVRIGHSHDSEQFYDIENLKFWNMDFYQKIKMSVEGIDRIVIHLIKLSKQIPLLNISHSVKDTVNYSYRTNPQIFDSYDSDKPSYSYACEAYWEPLTDEEALKSQLHVILGFLDNYRNLFRFLTEISVRDSDFEELISSFRKGIQGQTFITPWKSDFEGSRESLIAKMEKDPELEPWVNRYTHRRTDKSIIEHLFYDDNWHIKSEEEFYNTDNWIRILTIAAVLLEYDEHQNTVGADEDDEDKTLLLKLSPYLLDEAKAIKFLNSIRLMNDKEIITLVKKYRDLGWCTASKGLWKVLHDANLYKPLYTNWNAQLPKKIGRMD